MDNLFEYLLPIIFIAGSLLLNRKKKEEGSEEGEEPKAEPSSVEDIREEIRRRIREAQNPLQRQPEQSVEAPVPREEVVEQTSARRTPVISHNDQQAKQSYQRLERMRAKVEEMRAKADREKQKAASFGQNDIWERKESSHQSLRRSKRRSVVREVISELHDSESARKAILNAEILGTPVGLRKNGKIQPSWQQ